MSERNNADFGISGLLLYSNEVYLQLLEGPGPVLDRMWDRIAGDNRHSVNWVMRGKGTANLVGLPMGYFDADREPSGLKRNPLWRTGTADRTEDLRDFLIELAREKYPSMSSPA